METLATCKLCGASQFEDVYPSTWVRRCAACGYIFRSPRPTAEAVAGFHSQAGKYAHWLEEFAGREPCWRYRIALLRRFVKSGRLLDVGAGIGEFLNHARACFDVAGTEVADEGIRLARERFGLELMRGSLGSLNLPAASFDAISLIHVLEHVHDPAGTIAQCRRLLRPQGWLFVAVPNDSPAGWYKTYWGGRRMLRRLAARGAPEISYRETPPFGAVDLRASDRLAEIHLSHFSPECLVRFLSRSGFEVHHFGPDPAYTTTGLKRLKHELDFQSWRLISALFGRCYYQNMCIVTRSRPA